MKKFFKRLFIVIITFLILILTTGVLVTTVYADDVKNYVLKELDKNLTRPISFSDVDFTVWDNFPKATVVIKNIKAYSFEPDDAPFIDLERIDLIFNIKSILTSNFEISAIGAAEGEVNVIYNKKGQPNFNIWKSSNKDGKENSSFFIRDIYLKNVSTSYQDWSEKTHYAYFHEKSKISPDFDGDINLVGNIDGYIKNISTSSFSIQDSLNLTTEFTFNAVGNDFEVDMDGELLGSELKFKGIVKPLDNGLNLDLGLKLNTINLAILPKDILAQIPFKKGEMAIQMGIVGDLAGVKEPSLKLDYTLSNAELNIEGQNISDIYSRGKYHQEKLLQVSTGELILDAYSFDLGKSKVEGSGKINHFDNPNIESSLKAFIDLEDFNQRFLNNAFYALSGALNFDTEISGKLLEIFVDKKFSSLKSFTSTGNVELRNVAFQAAQDEMDFFFRDGNLSFDNRNINIIKLNGKAKNSGFFLDGTIKDFIKSILGEAPLNINANLIVDQFVTEDFISNDSVESSEDTAYVFSLPNNLNLDLNLKMESFSFRKFNAKDLRGKVYLTKNKLTFSNLEFLTCDGKAHLDGKVYTPKENRVIYECDAVLTDIDAKKAFYQFENFGQDVLKDEHVSGKITTSIYLLAESDAQLNIYEDKIYTRTKIKIANGRLKEFAPLMELESFLRSEFRMNFNLRDLKFQTIENDIEIINQTIYIPEMAIRTNDINLDISGKHKFNQEIEYLFKVKHSEIFKAKSNNQIDAKYGVVENNDKTATLPLLMTGTVDNPKFSYDMRTKSAIIKENLANEGKAIKDAFVNELKSIFKKDSTKTTKKSVPEINTTDKVKIVIDFDGSEEEEDEDDEDDEDEELNR